MENDTTQKPPPETRPRPGGETRPRPSEGETRPQPSEDLLTRGLAQDAATAYLLGTATGAGLATGALIAKGVASKVTDAVTSKDDGSKVILPPGTKSKD